MPRKRLLGYHFCAVGDLGSVEAATLMGQLQAELARLLSVTFYEKLGLTPGAETAQVRAAYLRLVKEYHPHRFTR